RDCPDTCPVGSRTGHSRSVLALPNTAPPRDGIDTGHPAEKKRPPLSASFRKTGPSLITEPKGFTMKKLLRSMLSRRVMLSMALASVIAILFAQPASASLRENDRVYFWESPGFVNDGVELGPSPRAWYLGGVTRDCVIFCWHDWNDIPSSMYVTQDA